MSTINQPYGSQASSGPANVRALADGAAKTIKQGAEDALDSAKDAASDLKDEAGKLAGDALESAKAYAEENKGKVAVQIDSVASALTKAADELDGSSQGAIAGYARQLADGVTQFSSAIRNKGVDELMAMVGTFAKSNPAAFVGGAALLGFAASRFAMAGVKTAQAAAPAASSTNGQLDGQPSIAEPWAISSATRQNGGTN